MDIKEKIEELRAELHRHNYNYDQYIYVKLNEDETEDCGDIKIFTENVAKNILTQIDNFSKK